MGCVATTLALPARAAAESSFSLGAKGTFDAGTRFVTGVQSGIGAGAALRATFGGDRKRWEVALDVDIAGFQGEGDGDPILQLAASLARRGYFGDGPGARPYWFAGAGRSSARAIRPSISSIPSASSCRCAGAADAQRRKGISRCTRPVTTNTPTTSSSTP